MTWKHRSHRFLLICIIMTLVVFTLTYVLFQFAAVKHITLTLNGEEMVIETKETELQHLLDEHNIKIGKYDHISKELDAPLKSGDKISIDQAIRVLVTADGYTRTMYTTGKTVHEAIQQFDLFVGDHDRVIPYELSKITENSEIEIVRVQTIVEEFEETVPFQVITQNDDALVKGKKRLVQAGEEGIMKSKVLKIIENGTIVSEQVIEEVIESESIDEIVAVGTQNPVTILSAASPDVEKVSAEGLSFGVKQILSDVTLTAYDAGINSTGKTEDHPRYGITYSGTTVMEGRTVAVDPNVIPLGWWIYIEGIGLRKAEDIGSAIKGKKVDVYMESEAQALRFGRQRGHTVYIVGPNKPILN